MTMNNAELATIVMNHVNRGGDTHPIVDEKTAGFLSPKMFISLNSLVIQRKWLSKVDISTLSPGYYEGNYFSDGPEGNNSSIAFIDVTMGGDNRKQIVYRKLKGQLWEKIITKDNAGIWGKIDKEVILWEGNSNLASPVSLKYPVYNKGDKNFVAIKIVYDYFGSINIDTAFGANQTATFHIINMANNATGINFCEFVLNFGDGTTAVVDNLSEMNLGMKGIYSTLNDPSKGRMSIKKIIGIL